MFNISIEQQVLAKALEYLEPTVGKNAQGLGDNCIYMETTGNGSVAMYTNNTIEFTSLEAIIANGGNSHDCSPYVDFKRLKKIVTSIPANTVINIIDKGTNLEITHGINTVNLATCTNGIMPLPPVAGTAVSIPKDFVMRALYGATSIIADNNSSPIYNCVRFYTNRNVVEATAIDVVDKRTFASVGTAAGINQQQEILVEANKMRKSLKIFEDYNEIEFTVDNNNISAKGADPVTHVNMKTSGMISEVKYICRRLTGVFPSNIYASCFPQPAEYMEVTKEDVLNCFTRIEALQDQTSLNVVNIKGGSEMQISAKTSHGNCEESIIPVKQLQQTSFNAVFRFPYIAQILKTKTFSSDSFEIASMPNYPANYIIKPAGTIDTMYTVPTISCNATP